MNQPTQQFLDSERRKACEWAREVLSRRDWLIFDSETTGLGDSAEIVSLALLFPDGHVHVEQKIKPIIPLTTDATKIHGITNKDLESAPTWKDIHHTLRVLLYKRQVLAYNAQYDIRLIAQSAASWDLPTPVHSSGCVMLQYAKYVGEWWSSKQDFKWPKLPVAEGETAHGALSDCRSTLELIRRMANSVL